MSPDRKFSIGVSTGAFILLEVVGMSGLVASAGSTLENSEVRSLAAAFAVMYTLAAGLAALGVYGMLKDGEADRLEHRLRQAS